MTIRCRSPTRVSVALAGRATRPRRRPSASNASQRWPSGSPGRRHSSTQKPPSGAARSPETVPNCSATGAASKNLSACRRCSSLVALRIASSRAAATCASVTVRSRPAQRTSRASRPSRSRIRTSYASPIVSAMASSRAAAPASPSKCRARRTVSPPTSTGPRRQPGTLNTVSRSTPEPAKRSPMSGDQVKSSERVIRRLVTSTLPFPKRPPGSGAAGSGRMGLTERKPPPAVQ